MINAQQIPTPRLRGVIPVGLGVGLSIAVANLVTSLWLLGFSFFKELGGLSILATDVLVVGAGWGIAYAVARRSSSLRPVLFVSLLMLITIVLSSIAACAVAAAGAGMLSIVLLLDGGLIEATFLVSVTLITVIPALVGVIASVPLALGLSPEVAMPLV